MTGWTAIVPVKPWAVGKSRLDDPRREQLARAFSLDTIEAVAATAPIARVVIVTAEPQLTGTARELGVTLLCDRLSSSVDGLEAAIETGRHWAARTFPTDPVVVVPGDLPSCRHEHLEQALAPLSGRGGAYVPDRHGTGTTLVAADSPWELHAAYGAGSAERHRQLGAREVRDVADALRTDVDTIHDLHAAAALGLGRHTSAVLGTVPSAVAAAGRQAAVGGRHVGT